MSNHKVRVHWIDGYTCLCGYCIFGFLKFQFFACEGTSSLSTIVEVLIIFLFYLSKKKKSYSFYVTSNKLEKTYIDIDMILN
jgi:hypothetical protein